MIVELGRLLDFPCEDILQETTSNYVQKYHQLEEMVMKNIGKKFCDLEEKEQQYWQKILEEGSGQG